MTTQPRRISYNVTRLVPSVSMSFPEDLQRYLNKMAEHGYRLAALDGNVVVMVMEIPA